MLRKEFFPGLSPLRYLLIQHEVLLLQGLVTSTVHGRVGRRGGRKRRRKVRKKRREKEGTEAMGRGRKDPFISSGFLSHSGEGFHALLTKS